MVSYIYANINSYSIIIHHMPYLLWSGDTNVPHACLLFKGLYASFTVITLGCHSGHVRPVEEAKDLGHGFGLVEVGGHRAGKVIVASLIAELGTGRSIAYLRNLKQPEEIGNLWGQTVKWKISGRIYCTVIPTTNFSETNTLYIYWWVLLFQFSNTWRYEFKSNIFLMILFHNKWSVWSV